MKPRIWMFAVCLALVGCKESPNNGPAVAAAQVESEASAIHRAIAHYWWKLSASTRAARELRDAEKPGDVALNTVEYQRAQNDLDEAGAAKFAGLKKLDAEPLASSPYASALRKFDDELREALNSTEEERDALRALSLEEVLERYGE